MFSVLAVLAIGAVRAGSAEIGHEDACVTAGAAAAEAGAAVTTLRLIVFEIDVVEGHAGARTDKQSAAKACTAAARACAVAAFGVGVLDGQTFNRYLAGKDRQASVGAATIGCGRSSALQRKTIPVDGDGRVAIDGIKAMRVAVRGHADVSGQIDGNVATTILIDGLDRAVERGLRANVERLSGCDHRLIP